MSAGYCKSDGGKRVAQACPRQEVYLTTKLAFQCLGWVYPMGCEIKSREIDRICPLLLMALFTFIFVYQKYSLLLMSVFQTYFRSNLAQGLQRLKLVIHSDYAIVDGISFALM